MSLPVVVINQRGDGLKLVGVAEGTEALLALSAPGVSEVPLHVPQNDKVQESISVQIDPRGTGGPSTSCNARLFCYIGKRAIAVVVIKAVASVCGDEQVLKAVVL